MIHGSLFSGIGGFDLAAEWMGWENVFHCEINKFCQKVLKYHFPNSVCYEDITKTDFSGWRGKIDIITGGFPCQPFSTAGKRKGKDDDRHLWPQMLRAIREIQPRWVVGENVPGLLNWKRGVVLAEIKADLEAAGFEVFPPVILPACGKNAPHRRDRLWIIGYAERKSRGQHNRRKSEAIRLGMEGNVMVQEGWDKGEHEFSSSNNDGIIANKKRLPIEFKTPKHSNHWMPVSEPGIFRGNDGIPDRIYRTQALGNAIVPQIAFEIFKAIEQFEGKLSDK